MRHNEGHSWLGEGLGGLLPSFRWSGLSGHAVDPGRFHVLESVVVEPGSMHVVFASIDALDTGGAPVMFSIPVLLAPILDPGVPGFTATGPGGKDVHVHLPLQDGAFWHRFLARVLGVSSPGDAVHVEHKDESFNECTRLLAAGPGKVGVSILGAGDTTNIVLKVSNHENPSRSFVVKWYPRFSFNPAAIIDDALRSGGFVRHARLLGTWGPGDTLVHALVSRAMSEDRARELLDSCHDASIPVHAAFPVIHVFPCIHGEVDGGFPFWLSARATARAPASPVDLSALEAPAKDAGTCVASFHDCLAALPVPGPVLARVASQSRHARIEAKLAAITRFIAGGPPDILAVDGWWHDVVAGVLGRVDVPALRRLIWDLVAPGNRNHVVHQDLHLGQFMIDEHAKYIILDLEGDPQLPWQERLAPCPVEKDLAAMIRSLSYIKVAAFRDVAEKVLDGVPGTILPLLFNLDPALVVPARVGVVSNITRALDTWEQSARELLLASYERYIPVNRDLLRSFIVARAVEELHYECTFRPVNVLVPLAGVVELLDRAAL